MSFIKERRTALNMSQIDLGNAVGATQASVSQWENGIAFPAADKLPKIAEVLKCTIDELFQRNSVSDNLHQE